MQNEMKQPVNRVCGGPKGKRPRLAGSCPMIFTWNGRQFEFVTDVLGVAPLGASSGGYHRGQISFPAERPRCVHPDGQNQFGGLIGGLADFEAGFIPDHIRQQGIEPGTGLIGDTRFSAQQTPGRA